MAEPPVDGSVVGQGRLAQPAAQFQLNRSSRHRICTIERSATRQSEKALHFKGIALHGDVPEVKIRGESCFFPPAFAAGASTNFAGSPLTVPGLMEKGRSWLCGVTRDHEFESGFLQRGVSDELDPGSTSMRPTGARLTGGRTGTPLFGERAAISLMPSPGR